VKSQIFKVALPVKLPGRIAQGVYNFFMTAISPWWTDSQIS